ncbi:unnamed protein product [Somion occarium]|uniref:Uncharacterized protein n=1 Tax=Somion occarium TaxID=3059160 RepID=A0ABP1CZ65_9APHY
MCRAFNIDRILSRFFNPPLAFRQLQARTGTLISGSAALQFFDRSFYKESDLDIYVPKKYRVEAGEFLLRCGYSFIPGQRQEATFYKAVEQRRVTDDAGAYAFRGVAAVLTFEKPAASGSAVNLKVQLIVAAKSPMEIILNFHSTCVMNVISFENAYSLYPKATFEARSSLVCATDGPKQEPAMEKYKERGWTMVKQTSVAELKDLFHFKRASCRYMGDKYCWTIPLDKDSITELVQPGIGKVSSMLTHDPVAASNWKLIYNPILGGSMHFDSLSETHLELKYVYASEQMVSLLYSVTSLFPSHEVRARRLKGVQRYYDEEYISLCLLHFQFQSGLQAIVETVAKDYMLPSHSGARLLQDDD